MSFFLTWLAIGVLTGFAFVWGGRQLNKEHLVFGISLLIAAIWYVGFGLFENIEGTRLIPQVLGGCFFGVCAVFGLRGSFRLLSIGWLLHLVWDSVSAVYLDATYVPEITLPGCVGFDSVVGIYLLLRHLGKYSLRGSQ